MIELTLPSALTGSDGGKAVTLLRDYYGEGEGEGKVGRFFDSWAHRPGADSEFTAEDVISLSFLSVSVPGVCAIALLEPSPDNQFNMLLSQIQVGQDLWTRSEPLSSNDPAWKLWQLLMDQNNIGPVLAGKLLARKRPRLVPIYDSVVGQIYRAPTGRFWEATWNTLNADGGALVKRLTELRTEAGLDERISILRVLDVITWMEGKRNDKCSA